ncbi:MAG TPA: hypothetical protein VF421_14415 [Niabella sp.]
MPIEKEISIGDIFLKITQFISFVKRRILLLTFVGLIGGAVGFLYAFSNKPKYVAALTFAIEDDKGTGGLGGALGLASSMGFDLGGGTGSIFTGANLIELFKSRKIIEQALLRPVEIGNEKLPLIEFYIRAYDLRSKWKRKNESLEKKLRFDEGSSGELSFQQDSMIGDLYWKIVRYELDVSQKDKKVSIITAEAKTENEMLSKVFVETLAKEVAMFYIDVKSKKAQNNVAILQRQADSVRGELNYALTGVAVATDQTFNLNPAFNVQKTPSAKRQIDVQANTVILTELSKNLELAKIALRKETPLIQVIDRPILPLGKEKKSKIMYTVGGAFLLELLTLAFIFIRTWARDQKKKQLTV